MSSDLYLEITSTEQLDYAFSPSTLTPSPTIAIDTEATPLAHHGSVLQRWSPYCFSFTLQPGQGFVIYLDQPDMVAEFICRVQSLNPLTIFHNYLFDAPICQSIGIPINRFDDTMIRAYNLQNIPRGLKPLAYRLCGMHMDSFNQVVTPWSREQVLEWAAIAVDLLHDLIYDPRGKPTKTHPQGKLLVHPRRRPEFTTNHARTCTKLAKLLDDCYTANPWDRWKDWHSHDREFVSSLISPIPPRSIAHCPRHISTPYVCADADATLRIRPKLAQLASRLRHSVEVT